MKVKKLKNYDDWGMPSRTGIGVTISVIYAGLLISLAIWRWSDIAKLDLNELGDFAAGAFGPMAILWLVLGYFQQGDELKQNTEALRLQADELANSVQQQQHLVAVTREQFEEAKRLARLEEARRTAAASPRFETSLSEWWDASEGTTVNVSMKNVGPPCSHIGVRSTTEGVVARRSFDPTKPQEFTADLFMPGSARIDETEFLVSYIDAVGNTGSQEFTVSWYRDDDGYGYIVSGDDASRVWNHSTQAAGR